MDFRWIYLVPVLYALSEGRDLWTHTVEYPPDVPLDQSGLFYTFSIDSTTFTWEAGSDHCSKMYGSSSRLYEPLDSIETDYISNIWLKESFGDMDKASFNVWTGLTKLEDGWRGQISPHNTEDVSATWLLSEGGKCGVWEVINNVWFDNRCKMYNHILCKKVNHYREVYQTDNTTSLVALVVDDMNYTTAFSECTHYGYKLYEVIQPEDMDHLQKLYQHMQTLTEYPIPTLYWVDSRSASTCVAWDAEAGTTRVMDCSQQLSYTCSSAVSETHLQALQFGSNFPDELENQEQSVPQIAAIVEDTDTLIHIQKRSVNAKQASADGFVEEEEDAIEAPGSKTIGLITVSVIGTIGILILLSDIPTLFMHIRMALGYMAGYCCSKDNTVYSQTALNQAVQSKRQVPNK